VLESAVGSSLADQLSRASALLAEAGCSSPRLDAELLMAAAVGITRAGLYLAPGASLAPAAAERFDQLLRRRVEREPLAYIVGSKAFRRISLQVDRRVLIPRPETELLVEVGLGLAADESVGDVGTGSGAVALALKDERPDLRVWGTDVSRDALELARTNADRLSLDVSFLQGDLLVGGPYDAVLANLPYVATGDALDPEVRDYEPPGALWGGADGLDLVRRLLSMVAGVGLVALEVGAGQAAEVERLMRGTGFGSVERWRDLAGHERVLVGRR
jgi:release factor glutamine methyltransferase